MNNRANHKNIKFLNDFSLKYLPHMKEEKVNITETDTEIFPGKTIMLNKLQILNQS